MDTWSLIAICLVVPAVLFLIAAAAAISLRMSRKQVNFLLLAGLIALPIAVACIVIREWVGSQLWMHDHWWYEISRLLVRMVGNLAGLLAAFALIAALTLAIRRGICGRSSQVTGK